MNEKSPLPQKVYYRNSRFISFIIAGILGLVAILYLIPLFSPSQSITSLIRTGAFPILLLGFAVLLIYSAQHIRLITSPKGVEYYQVGYSICTSWENIEYIGKVRAGRVLTEARILHEPTIQVSKGLFWFNWLKHRGQAIPLSLFNKEWRNTDLGQDIREYASYLLEKSGN